VKKKDKTKAWCFYQFEIRIAMLGVSMCYFHAFIYYNPNWFISSNSLHSSLVPFQW
jgi:hypothetical protein